MRPAFPGRLLPGVLVGLFGLLLAAPAARAAPPAFFVEAIEVRGLARLPAAVITSESLLVAGREYGEDELRDAVHRIERLPFVLEARFALAKGSERGRYGLVIEVVETRSFFFAGELRWTAYGERLVLDEGDAKSNRLATSRLAGFRRFLGPYDVVFAAVSEDDGFQLGWTRYRLFGRPALLSFEYTRGVCCEVTVPPLGLDPALAASLGDPSETFEITAGLPLGRNRGLRLELESRTATDGVRRSIVGDDPGVLVFDRRKEERAELLFLLDSSDDPFFPSAGGSWSVGIDLRTVDADLREVLQAPIQANDYRSRLARATLTGARHFAPSLRQTISLSGRLSAGKAEVEGLPEQPLSLTGPVDLDVWDVALAFRHSFRLPRGLERRLGELRWETSVEVAWEGTSPSLGLRSNPFFRTTVATGPALRNEWGLFRLTFSFLDLRSER